MGPRGGGRGGGPRGHGAGHDGARPGARPRRHRPHRAARPSSRCCATTASTSRSSGRSTRSPTPAGPGHDGRRWPTRPTSASDSATIMGEASAGADRLVLLSPTAAQLAALDLPLTSGDLGAPWCPSPPRCTLHGGAARRHRVAGRRAVDPGQARRAGRRPRSASRCPTPRRRAGQRPTTSASARPWPPCLPPQTTPRSWPWASPAAFTNRWVDEESHAGLAIRALGHSPRLLWYQPGIGDLANFSGSRRTPPGRCGWRPAAAVLATAVLVLAFVRGRRMGALVTEPLPVVVRAVETTESRGRIYRRARDRGRAAAILRLGSTERLARRLALPPHAAEAVQAAAAAASGMPPAQVAALLAGPPPTTDVELHTLANALTDLEERVRTLMTDQPHPTHPAGPSGPEHAAGPAPQSASPPMAGTSADSPSPPAGRPHQHPTPGPRCWPSGPRSPRPSSGRTQPWPGCSSPSSRRGHILLEGVPGRRQDAARAQPRRRPRRRDQAGAVHPRPDARRPHRVAGLRRVEQRLHLPPGPGLHQPPARRRDQPHAARRRSRRCWRRWRSARSASTAVPHPLPAAVHGRRHAEPRRVRRHLSPAGGPARPVPAQGDAADPAPRRRDRRPAPARHRVRPARPARRGPAAGRLRRRPRGGRRSRAHRRDLATR